MIFRAILTIWFFLGALTGLLDYLDDGHGYDGLATVFCSIAIYGIWYWV